VQKHIVVSSIFLTALIVTVTAHAADPEAFSSEWTQLQTGVYKKVDIDGTTTIAAFGSAGASYDRAAHSREISRLKSKVLSNRAGSDELTQLATLQRELEAIPEKASDMIVPLSSNNGSMCEGVSYSLDSHFGVGKGGGTTVARANWGFTLWGPQPPSPTVTVYSRAQVTAATFPTVTTTKTSSTYAFATADFQKGIPDDLWVDSTSCTGATYSKITVNQGIPGCNYQTPGFASLTKTYSTCVGGL
jgi:hypothetical protein